MRHYAKVRGWGGYQLSRSIAKREKRAGNHRVRQAARKELSK